MNDLNYKRPKFQINVIKTFLKMEHAKNLEILL